jgi:peptidoglycan/LPS O-acetylase OafA/YrhL
MTDERQRSSDRIGTHRVRGLDSIRFICAVWVLVGHAGPLPYVMDIDRSTTFGLLVSGVLHNLISGPAAVIVFFVISGFCIHFPYRHATTVQLLPYFARRHIRILTPVAAAILLGGLVGVRLPIFQDSILWSLVCEEVYYTLYPLILRARALWGWPRLIGLAFASAYAVVLTNPTAGNYPSYGPALNWILGIPCWLLGCQLAERWDIISPDVPIGRQGIWVWRIGVLATSVVLSGLRFHTPLTYPWTLDLFAILVAMWLGREVVAWIHRPPLWLLELGGLFSYSIYLVHLHGLALFQRLGLGVGLPILVGWLWELLFVLAVCLLFYAVVERPSHRLARFVYHVIMTNRERRIAAIQPSPNS